MIFWRDGKAGFVGAAKKLIRGFFSFQHSVTTDSVAVTPLSFGVNSIITSTEAVLCTITETDGVLCTMTSTEAKASAISSSFGVKSLIDTTGG